MEKQSELKLFVEQKRMQKQMEKRQAASTTTQEEEGEIFDDARDILRGDDEEDGTEDENIELEEEEDDIFKELGIFDDEDDEDATILRASLSIPTKGKNVATKKPMEQEDGVDEDEDGEEILASEDTGDDEQDDEQSDEEKEEEEEEEGSIPHLGEKTAHFEEQEKEGPALDNPKALPSSSKYVPPHLRKQQAPLSNKQNDVRYIGLQKSLRSLVNKISIENLRSLAKEALQLYRTSSKNGTKVHSSLPPKHFV